MTSDPSSSRRGVGAEIASATAHIYHELLGKGPTKVRAYVEPDVIVVVMEDMYSIAERTMIAAGAASDVVAMRHRMQEAVRDRFVEVVERLSGRTVRAFLSQNNVNPDVAVEVFLLTPLPGQQAENEGIAAEP